MVTSCSGGGGGGGGVGGCGCGDEAVVVTAAAAVREGDSALTGAPLFNTCIDFSSDV